MRNAADSWSVLRVLSVCFVMVVTSCGLPQPESADTVPTTDHSTNPQTAATSSSTTADSVSTSSSTTTTDTVAPTSSAPSELPAELGLEPGVPIATPAGFPSVDELATMVNPFRGLPYPRARISSQLVVVGDREALAAQGIDLSLLEGTGLVITYFDGLKIWDYSDGSREVQVPGGELLYQAEDGSWQESSRFEWPPIPLLPEWFMAQQIAEDMLQTEPRSVGYELIADVATLHLEVEGATAHLWVDETGAVIRFVADVSGPEGDFPWFTVWNVETLSPELIDPLPDQP